MKNTLTELLEQEEMIKKLTENGYGYFVEALLMNESKVYTKKGRLNKSGVCRVLGCTNKELEEIIESCKAILFKEMAFE